MDENKHWIVRGRHNPEKNALQSFLSEGVMTPSERKLWSAVRANRLGGLHIRKQQVINGFIADFDCHAKGLVIEVDGEVHEGQTRGRRATTRGARQSLPNAASMSCASPMNRSDRHLPHA